MTPNYRKAISCHFVSGDCRFINVRGTLQEELEAELRELLKIKLKRMGQTLDAESELQFQMKDVWEMKSRVVQGDQMILPIDESASQD